MTAYIILNEDKTFFSQFFKKGEQPSNAIEYTYTGNFVKPKFDVSKSEAYEGATEEEIEAYNDQFYPDKVTILQFKTQLLTDGLKDDVENALNALLEPEKSYALLKYQYATEFLRKDPLVQNLGAMIGLSNQDINEFFNRANNI